MTGPESQTNPLLRVQAPIIAINSIMGTLPDSSSITTTFQLYGDRTPAQLKLG
ncbi:MAG: hypothetical protein MH219_14955 [Marinobacter sp.]|nr:hypothetical protein [Marinobacter sp.]